MANNEPDDPNSKHKKMKHGFVIECVNVDEPKQRAYLYLKSLPDGLRGEYLVSYIDLNVKLCSPDDKNQSHEASFDD